MVEQLTKILQRMENPKPLQLDLLEYICEKKPGRKWPTIRVSCPCNPSGHLVSKDGFLLLEAVEGAFASAEQQIEKISVRELRGSEGLLSALSSRAERQQGKVSNLVVDRIRLDDLNSTKLLHSLFKNSRRVTGHTRPFQLRVEGDISMEGWEALAKAVGFHPGRFYMLTVSKKVMLTAKAKDLKTIHDAFEDRNWGGWRVKENVNCSGKCIRRIYTRSSEKELEEFLARVEEQEAVEQKAVEQEVALEGEAVGQEELLAGVEEQGAVEQEEVLEQEARE